MKLLFVIHRLAGIGGGAERVFCDVCNGLNQGCHEVHVATFDVHGGQPFYSLDVASYTNLFLTRLDTSGEVHGKGNRFRSMAKKIYQSIPDNRLLSRLKWNYSYGKVVDKLCEFVDGKEFECIVAFLPPAFAVAGHVKQRTSIPLILSSHSIPARDLNDAKRWDQNPVVIQSRTKALEIADKIFVLSKSFVQEYPEILRSKVHVLPNMVPQLAPFVPFEDRSNVILAIGRLVKSKQFDHLIKAWARISENHLDWKVKIFGDGPEFGTLKSLIETYGVSDSVFLCGNTLHVGEEYMDAKLVVHPSEFEGFGMVVAEALSSSVPVVGYTTCTGLNELVVDGENGILVASEEELSKAVDELLNDSERLRFLSSNAASTVESYSSHTIMDLWEHHLYEFAEEGYPE